MPNSEERDTILYIYIFLLLILFKFNEEKTAFPKKLKNVFATSEQNELKSSISCRTKNAISFHNHVAPIGTTTIYTSALQWQSVSSSKTNFPVLDY